MARTRTLQVVIAGDADKLSSELKRGGKDLDSFGKQSKKAGDEVEKLGKHTRLTASITSKGFHGMRLAATGLVGAVGGVTFALKGALTAASDINESLTKNQALFGKYSKGIEAYAKTTARSLGVSRSEALSAAGTFGGLFDAINIGEKQSAKMSQRLVTLAADLASFNNASPEETLTALRSGLAGEAEPMRRFNAFLSETRVKAEAASSGIGRTAVNTEKLKAAQITASVAQERYTVAVARYGQGSAEARTAQVSLMHAEDAVKKARQGGTSQLTEAQKVQARFNLILKDTTKAHGDFKRTSQGDANQTRILKAEYADMTAELGEKLLPIKVKVTRAITKFVGEMQDGTGKGGKFVDTLKDIWTEAKPVVTWIGRAIKNIAEFTIDHPGLAKMLAGIVAVGGAVKGLKFVSATTGFTDLLKAGRAAARTLRSVLASSGTTAGEAVAANSADALTKRTPTFRKAANAMGRAAGKGMVAGFVIAIPLLVYEFKDQINKAGDWFRHKTIIGKILFGGMNLGDKISKFLGIGEGTGKTKLPGGGGKAGNLMGARGSLSPFAAIGSRFGLHVSSGRRPGAITSSGNVSYHSTGEAIDEAGSAGGMLQYFRYLKENYGSRLAELIYTPGGMGVKDGHPFRYTGQVAADHYDHVHVAIDSGRAGVGDGIGKGALVNLWTRAGGSPARANMAAAIAMAESGGNPDAKNVNTDGSIDRGLWQINSIHGALSTYSPTGNAHAAVRISSGGSNWAPWVTYKTGAYKRFLAGATSAGGSRGSGSTSEALQRSVDANQTRIDALRNQLDRVPKGLAGAVQRDKIQAQIRGIQATQRGLRSDLKDAPTAAERQDRAERSGSQLVNRIVQPFMKGFRLASGRARDLGAQIEDADTQYGQAERLFGQTDEDLGTAAGRKRRISELTALAGLKAKTLGRERKRAAALQKAIGSRESMLKRLRKARNATHGAKRAKINERIRSYEDSLDDLKAELHALGFAIRDTELDIGDLAKEARDVAATEDTAVEPGPTVSDRVSDLTGLVDLKERAGLLTADQANTQRQAIIAAGIQGKFGATTEREQLQLMGDLREAQQAGVQAVEDNTQAIRDLQKSIDDNTAFARSVMATENASLTKSIADLISGQIAGVGIAGRALMPSAAGAGRARY